MHPRFFKPKRQPDHKRDKEVPVWRVGAEKKISLLGTLAIVVGTVAWFATRAQVLGEGPVVIGACGAVLALLAFLGASLFEGTGRIVPLAGLLACGSAIGFGITHNTTGVGAVDQLRQFVDRFKSAPSPAPTPTIKPAAPSPPSVPVAEDKPVGSGTIFDMTPVGKGSPAASASAAEKPAPPTVAAAPAPASVLPFAPAPNATQRYTAAMTAVTKAHAKLDAATAGLLPALSKTDAYQAAKTELDAADVALQAARANGPPGNPELVDAGQRYLNAKAAMQKLINAAAATDPQTVAAKQELIEAQGELRAAKEDLANTGGAGKK